MECCKSQIPLESCLLHCHTCFPGGDRLRFLQCQNLLQHPAPHTKSSLTLHACACFSGREPGASLLPPLGREKEHKCPGCLGTLALHLSLIKNFLCFTSLRGTLGSVQSSLVCEIFLPTPVSSQLGERGPSGGPGCDHHIYKCGKQRLTSYEPCGIINTAGFSFSYWRESCKY